MVVKYVIFQVCNPSTDQKRCIWGSIAFIFGISIYLRGYFKAHPRHRTYHSVAACDAMRVTCYEASWYVLLTVAKVKAVCRKIWSTFKPEMRHKIEAVEQSDSARDDSCHLGLDQQHELSTFVIEEGQVVAKTASPLHPGYL